MSLSIVTHAYQCDFFVGGLVLQLGGLVFALCRRQESGGENKPAFQNRASVPGCPFLANLTRINPLGLLQQPLPS